MPTIELPRIHGKRVTISFLKGRPFIRPIKLYDDDLVQYQVTPAFTDIKTLIREEAVRIVTPSPFTQNFLRYKVGRVVP
jgi:hypothetical protein